MALLHDARTVRFAPVRTPVRPRITPSVRAEVPQDRAPSPAPSRLRTLATSPTTALVVMLLGLVMLFALPAVGLPFVAVIVLPAVVYHLRAEHRVRLRRTR